MHLVPRRVKSCSGLTLWLPPAPVATCFGVSLVPGGRVMKEEAAHSLLLFLCLFVCSLPPPCALAWYVCVTSPRSPGSQVCQWEPCLALWLTSAPSESQGHCAHGILSPELSVLGCCLLPEGKLFLPAQCSPSRPEWTLV